MWEYFYYAAQTVYKTMSMQSLASGYSTFIDGGVRRSHQVMKNVKTKLSTCGFFFALKILCQK